MNSNLKKFKTSIDEALLDLINNEVLKIELANTNVKPKKVRIMKDPNIKAPITTIDAMITKFIKSIKSKPELDNYDIVFLKSDDKYDVSIIPKSMSPSHSTDLNVD